MANNPYIGKNVKFLAGTQAELESLGTLQQGAFYLTNDSNRLYVARGTSKDSLALLNQTVKIVNSLDELNALKEANKVNENDFAYIAGAGYNILAVYSGGNWVQINKNTDTIAHMSEVSVAATEHANGVTLQVGAKLDTDGSEKTDSILIKEGSSNVHIDKDGDAIKIAVDAPEVVDYELVTDATAKTLTLSRDPKDANGDSFVTFIDGTNTTVVITSDNKISFNAVDTKVVDFKAANATAGFNFEIKDNEETPFTTSIDPVIKYGNGGSSSVHFVNGTATLDTYTKAQVDNLFELKTNAMTYKGVISSASALPANPENGDTWLFNADSTPYGIGDLAIWNKEANKWDLVPAGNDIDSTYAIDLSGDGFIFEDHNLDSEKQYKVVGVSGDSVSVAEAVSGNVKTVTIEHKDVTVSKTSATALNQTAKGSLTFNHVKSIEDDGQGHITKITTEQVTVLDTDTHANIAEVKHGVSAANGIATIETEVKDSDNVAKKDSFKVSSTSLSVTAGSDNKTVNVELVWGSFTD